MRVPSHIFFLLIVTPFLFTAYSQRRLDSYLKRDNLAFSPDTLTVRDSVRIQGKIVSVGRSTKSPTLAIALSAVLPGAGQVYTERYWKIPLIWGFGAWFASQWIKAQDLYSGARDRYRASVERGENGGRGNSQYLYERDFYHDERDRFAFYIAITYVLNIVDAYVGASLYNFDVSEDLGGTARLQLNIRIR